MLYFRELLFFRMQVDRNADYLSVLELPTNLGILNIFLKSSDIIRLDILTGIFTVTGYGNRIKHPHEISK